ncbi:hypothetical protein EYR40_003837 [Pleurotus pulmonarius]|nr:hypothetical protein EYR40_003837 [Pleurotus pulmonarius]
MPVTLVERPCPSEGVRTDYRFIDIGDPKVNLTDPVFRGVHRGKRKHDDDFEVMIERSKAAGVKSMIITGGSLQESREALQLAETSGMWATVGCHPTRSTEFDKAEDGPEGYLRALDQLVQDNIKGKGRAVAIGECGLDYDRTHFAVPEVQKTHFRESLSRSQLGLARKYHLPLFLHSRAAHADLVAILREEGFGEEGGKAAGGKGGVVHSFTGTIDEAVELMNMGFHISVNGCGLKTEDNLKAAAVITLDKLMLETDSPWCSCTSTHASKSHLASLPAPFRDLYFPPSVKPESFVLGKAVKGRNEPTAIGGVAWVMHKLLGVPFDEVVERAWKNTVDVFGLEDVGME